MENTHTSLTGVLYTKFVEYVSEKPLSAILKFLGLSFLAGLISSFLTAPDATQTALYATMQWKNGLLTAIAWSIALVFYSPKLFRFIVQQIVDVIEFFSDQSIESDETIEGVPVNELIDHLFENQSFKRDDIEQIFAMPRNRYQRLAEKMEELDILTRGENNSRVLNPEMTRSEVIEHLKGKRVAMELEKPLNIVRAPLPSSPVFVKRKIAQTA